jgi:hypothetical protein
MKGAPGLPDAVPPIDTSRAGMICAIIRKESLFAAFVIREARGARFR